jgi:hypothetical protein
MIELAGGVWQRIPSARGVGERSMKRNIFDREVNPEPALIRQTLLFLGICRH